MNKNIDKITSFSQKKVFEYNGKVMDFRVPGVMGIINLTPDSFYQREKGKGEEEKRGSGEARKMIEQCAYIIDIGAVSTRPGAAAVTVEEEKRRLLPVLKEIRKAFPEVIISIDTFRSEIAKIAADEGADMINDISGGTFDPDMISTIVKLQIPFVIMHIQGIPATMQINPTYADVVSEVKDFLLGQALKLETRGHHKIILDPGFGFGKSVAHNYQLLAKLDEFVSTGYPILVGLSRKSMINKVLGIKPEEALNGTTVLNTMALLKGAAILRVHDVAEAMQTVKLCQMFLQI
jgi:dihydropteroate synthase